MLSFLALVAVTAAYALFDTDVHKMIGSFALYFPLVVPFLVAYARVAPLMDMALMQGLAMLFIMAAVSTAGLIDNVLLSGSTLVELLRLSKKFLKKRWFRYFLSLLSITVFTLGVTSLALFLPLYALIVPFTVVVCALAVPMLANVYEDRKEIFTLATVGLNPTCLQGLFLVEAVIIGFVGGGVGYASGLLISILASLPLTMVELSTGWITTVILASLSAAVVASIYPSLKASMVATPSLLKRWWHEAPPLAGWPPVWTVKIPVKLREDNVDSFIDFFLDYARTLEGLRPGSIERAEDAQLTSQTVDGEEVRRLRFKYIFNEGSTPMITTQNELRVSKSPRSKEYAVSFTVKVVTHVGVLNLYQPLERIVSTHRRLAIEWSEISRALGR